MAGHYLTHEQLAANLPVILFDPLGADTNQLIKAFVKTLEEAGIFTTNTSGLTSTQFECFTLQCRRVVMDSLDIEPGTVDGREAVRVVDKVSASEKLQLS